jgi:TatD DNase family protein
MASDAHAHPADLARLFPGAEAERRAGAVRCAASAWNRRDFDYHRELARRAHDEGAAALVLCFAVHPQLPGGDPGSGVVQDSLDTLGALAAEGLLGAVGETGFDLYNGPNRDAEKAQDVLFQLHLETALDRDLPLVLHVRRAMAKVFAHTGVLKKLPAVIFHSYSGTAGEGEALLRRGVNAFFSFGAVITLNHKTAMTACAALPLDRLLTETDAPYQPPRGQPFSRWGDLPAIIRAAAALRRGAGKPGGLPEELEAAADANFCRAFGLEPEV